MSPARSARRRRLAIMCGWTSTAMTRPSGPTSRASSRVKKPIPGPGSRTVIPVCTNGSSNRAGFCASLRMGLARMYPAHHGQMLYSVMLNVSRAEMCAHCAGRSLRWPGRDSFGDVR
jgi:hypothetical protein